MPIKTTVLATVMAISALNMNVTALVFLDPKADEKGARKHLASSLVRHTGEKVLMEQGNVTDPTSAASVFVLVRSPYKELVRALRMLLSQRFGIASEAEIVTQGAKDPASAAKILYQYPDGPLLGKGFVGLSALGIRIERPVEYRIYTGRYNQLEAISGYSELEVRLADGKQLFGKDCTVIVLRRTDHSREWYRHFQLGIPLPFKHDVAEDLVTSTEINLIEDVARSMGRLRVEYFVPYSGVRGADYWHDFVRTILRTVETF
ncbi:hypothetical protein [Nitrospira sp. Kam-Ns4a]